MNCPWDNLACIAQTPTQALIVLTVVCVAALLFAYFASKYL
jgi:hypothetical protein